MSNLFKDISCGGCRYWVQGSNMPRNAQNFGPDGGECRVNPPRGGNFHVYQEAHGEGENLNKVSMVTFPFPPTHRLDWCGAFAPLTEGQRHDR